MGGGPDKEHMVVILFGSEPKQYTDEIRKQFPYIEVTYFSLDAASVPVKDEAEKIDPGTKRELFIFNYLMKSNSGGLTDLFKKATILVTLAALPPKPEDAPNLKWIHFFSAGVDRHLSHPIIKDTDIIITTSSGIHGPPIAEWVLMTTLVFTKSYNSTYELQKKHVWGKNNTHFMTGEDWVGKRIGIAGYGSIGRQVANVFHSLGSIVVAYTASPRPTPSSRRDTGYIVPGTGDPSGTIPSEWYSGTHTSDLHHFLSQNLDALVITLPLTPATRHLFGPDEFHILSQNQTPSGQSKTFLINISRGAIVQQPSLVTALTQHQLRGAALDVTDPEPLPPHDPLWDAPNVIITPHISGLGKEYLGRVFDVVKLNLRRREKGDKMVNVVDRKKGY